MKSELKLWKISAQNEKSAENGKQSITEHPVVKVNLKKWPKISSVTDFVSIIYYELMIFSYICIYKFLVKR